MNILFLGDIVGNSGCNAVKKFLPDIVKSKKINFVAVNGEPVVRLPSVHSGWETDSMRQIAKRG